MDDPEFTAFKNDVLGQLSKLTESVKTNTGGLNAQFSSLKDSVDNLKKDLTKKVEDEKKDLKKDIADWKSNVDIDIAGVNNRLGDFHERLVNLEQNQPSRKDFDSRFSAVFTGIPFEEGEDPKLKAEDVIQFGLSMANVAILRAIRWGAKPDQNRHGIIKAEFSTEQLRDKVVQASPGLKDTERYKKVYIRNKRTSEQMVTYKNNRQFLKMIPGGSDYRVGDDGSIYKPKPRSNGGRGGGRGGRRGGGQLLTKALMVY